MTRTEKQSARRRCFESRSGATVRVSEAGAPGTAIETHLCIELRPEGSFSDQLAALEDAYREALSRLELTEASTVFRRIFVSDCANQAPLLRDSWLLGIDEKNPIAVSLLEQAPLRGAKLALWAYHVPGLGIAKKRRVSGGVAIQRAAGEELFLVCPWHEGLAGKTVEFQTRSAFDDLDRTLAEHGATLADSVLRTWIFVEAVDLDYMRMVHERARIFEEHGLTAKTHYIASTGIAGRRSDPKQLVTLEAYALPGITQDRIRHLEAAACLGPTSDYGVTFERGSSIAYGDRQRIFISGTASIDPSGEVLYKGDVLKQTKRAFHNIQGLLEDTGADLDDLVQMIVYLRDPADARVLDAYLQRHFPELPHVLVHAPVCRPEWLVEIECIAIRAEERAGLPPF